MLQADPLTIATVGGGRTRRIILLVVFFLILPLPNEFADFLLARSKVVTTKWFLVISYALNGVGMFAILVLGKHH